MHVLADAGKVDLRFDAYLGEYFRVTDARKLENLHSQKAFNIGYPSMRRKTTRVFT